MTLIEAAKRVQAAWQDPQGMLELCKAMGALDQAIAEAEQQEPVAWKHDCAALLANDVELWIDHCPHCGKPRTTSKREWQGLTDEDIQPMCKQDWVFYTVKQWAQIIEAKLKEKNT